MHRKLSRQECVSIELLVWCDALLTLECVSKKLLGKHEPLDEHEYPDGDCCEEHHPDRAGEQTPPYASTA